MSTPKHLFVFAQLQINDLENREKTLFELEKLKDESLKEFGCIQFDILEDMANKDIVYVYEEYKDRAAMDDHFDEPHTKHYLDQELTKVVDASFMTKFS
ncbi:MAG: antibiotic biosynthesis monooxygenase [Bdellovibrionota bacterium]|nr:antibiotic biosynthesis monooxygenase [Bdellovibrionota bacterium]